MKKQQQQQKPTDPATAPQKPGKRDAPPWMADDTRVVFSEERSHEDG